MSQRFLINSPAKAGKRKGSKRRTHRKHRKAQPSARRKGPMARKKRRARKTPRPMVGKATRRRGRRFGSNPPRRGRGRRTFRRNPGLVGLGIQAAKDAAAIVGSRVAVKALPAVLKLPTEGNKGLAVQAGVALILGFAADRFLGRDMGRIIAGGALSAPLSAGVAQALPAAAAGESSILTAVRNGLNGDSLGAYPMVGMGAYPGDFAASRALALAGEDDGGMFGDDDDD